MSELPRLRLRLHLGRSVMVGPGKADLLAAKEAEYKARFANPFVAAQRGFIDDVIMPHGTRRRVISALKTLANKQQVNPARKHDNIPL